MRFSLGFLMALLCFSALGCAALVNATEIWAEACFTVTALTILFAVTGGLFARGRLRTFAGGFAICSLAYFLLVNLPATESIKPLLLTTRALDIFERQLPQQEVILTEEFPLPTPIGIRSIGIRRRAPSTQAGSPAWRALPGSPFASRSLVLVQQIGHSLWAVVLGLAGGLAAQALAAGKLAAGKLAAGEDQATKKRRGTGTRRVARVRHAVASESEGASSRTSNQSGPSDAPPPAKEPTLQAGRPRSGEGPEADLRAKLNH